MKKIILHLCADIGSDSKYYQLDKEYEVIMIGEGIGVENYTPPENVHGIIANPVCFTAEAPIVTRRGVIRVSDVVVGDEVLTHKMRWRKVTSTSSRESHTVSLGTMTCTPDHPILARKQQYTYQKGNRVWELGEAMWTPASDMTDLFMGIPQSVTDLSIITPPIDWWLVGRWVADGFGRSSRKNTGAEVHIAVGKGKEVEFEQHAPDWKPTAKRTATVYVKYGNDLLAWLKTHFGYGAGNKTIPGWLLAQPESSRKDFLNGYLSGNGYHPCEGKWCATTISLNLAVSIRLLAESLGYTTCLSKNKLRETSIIEGRVVQQHLSWTVCISENDSRYSRTINGIRWVKHRKGVHDAGNATVYCLSVDEDESYICWGFIVHNCTEFSTAKGFHKKNDIEKGMFLVRHCQRIIELANPKWWVMENPANGRLQEVIGKPMAIYQPWEYGSPWTKKTALWGKFVMPEKIYEKWEDCPKNNALYVRPGRQKPSLAFLHKSAVDFIPEMQWAKDRIKTDADIRSMCSDGFAKAFYLANK